MGEISDALRRASSNSASVPLRPAPPADVPDRTPLPPYPAEAATGPLAAGPVDAVGVARLAPEGFARECYRNLAMRVLRRMQECDARTLQVTSAAQQEGKTTTSLHLAISLAQLRPEAKIMLLDLDLRRPSLALRLGSDAPVGDLPGLLAGRPVAECAAATDLGKLFVAGVVDGAREVHDTLTAPMLSRLCADLERGFDFTIVDSPPVLGISDALSISLAVDAWMLVVRQGESRMAAVAEALAELDASRLLGVFLNADGRHSSSRAYGYGYGPGTDADAERERNDG